MTHNSILQLKGVHKQIILSEAEAKSLQKIHQDTAYPSDFPIRLGGMSFRKGSINYIEVTPDGGRADDNQEQSRKFYEQEKETRKMYLSLPKEKLASYLDTFSLLFKVSTGSDPVADDLARAKAIQLEFFKANTRRTLCDLHLFKPIIPMKKSTMNIWESGAVKLLERAIMRDMHLEK